MWYPCKKPLHLWLVIGIILQGVCRNTANFVRHKHICSKKTLLLPQLLQIKNVPVMLQ
jgi:hypothetical protein